MPDKEVDEDIVSDPELITRVRAGDRSAFGELYRRHSGPATTLSRQFARSAAESDDLVSESFARVLDNLLSGKGPDTAFRAYLFTTIRNTAYDRTRKDKRLQFTDDMTTHDVAVIGDDPVLAKMESGLVATAFAQLPERWQAVLWHTQVEGESPAKVGALLGMAPGAVSSLAFRAREGLREAYLQAHLAETAAEQCRKTVESLGAWTRGGLSKREKAQVDAHLETCERCRALAAELEEVNSGLRGLLAPLLLGGAAAGYLATLGPVAPLAAPGTLAAGAAASGGAGSGGAGSGGAGGGAAGGGAAGGGTGAAGAGAAGAAGGSAAATTGAAVAAGAAAVAAGAVGTAAYANAQAGGSTAGGAGAAGGTAAGGTAAAGAGAGGAAGGLAGVIASMGVGGLVAAGAAVLVAAVAAVVFVVSGSSPETTTAADQQGASSQPAPDGSSGANGSAAGTGPAAAGGTDSSAGPQGSGTAPGTGTEANAATGANIPAGDAVTPATVTQAIAPAAANVPAGDAVTPANDSPGAASTAAASTAAASPGATNTAAASTADSSSAVSTGTSNPSNPPDTSSTATNPPLTPFAIVVSPFTAPTLTAGGTGVVTVTVANTGDQSAPVQPLTVTVPTGVSVTGVDVTPGGAALRRSSLQLAAVPCAPGGAQTCTSELPEIAGHASLVVTISLKAAPTATDGSVSIQVGAAEPHTTTMSVGTPIASLSLNTDAPLVAGTANARTITVGTAGGVTDPGPITFTSGPNGTFGGSANCLPPTGGPTITCTGTTIGISIVIPDKRFAGELSITVADAGGRKRTIGLTVVTPATLQLSPLTISEPLVAGGAGQLVLIVHNTGGLSSAEQTIDATLPDGVTVTGVTAGKTLICKGLGGTCLLPALGADESVSLVFDLHVCRCVVAHPFPPATVSIGGITGETASTQLTVGSGITALATVPDGPFVAGSRNPLTVTATVAKGVTNPGKVTFTSTSRFVTFGGAKNCETVKPPGTGVSAIKCDGTSYPMTITITKDQQPGDLPVLATDAGGRSLPLLDADDHPMQVVAPGRLQLSELTLATAVQAGGVGSLTLTVTNPNPDPSERMDIGITLDKQLILFHVDGLGAGPLSGNCGPFWHRTCRLPAIGKQPLTLTFTVLAPRTAKSGTLSVTIDHSNRSNTFAVGLAQTTDALSLTLGPPTGPATESAPTPAGVGGDQHADLVLGQDPASSGSDVPTTPPPTDLKDNTTTATETTAPEATGGSQTTGGPTASGSATSAPGTTATVATSTPAAPAPTDPAPASASELTASGAPSSTGSPVDAPTSSDAPSAPLTNSTPGDTAAGDPPTTAAAPARVRLSAPFGGDPVAPGGAIALGFTAGNTGGDYSAETPIDLVLPEGVEVRRITVDGNAVCTQGDGCLLPALKPGATVHVIVEVRVGIGASGGAALITVNGSGVGWRLMVLSSSLTTDQPGTEPTTDPSAAHREPPG